MMSLNCLTVLTQCQTFNIISSTLSTNSPIHIYINRINKRLVFKIKDRYKLELQTPETMKLFASPKQLIDKTKHGENVPSLEVAEVVLINQSLRYYILLHLINLMFIC